MKPVLGGLLCAALIAAGCASDAPRAAGRASSSMSMTVVQGGAAAAPAPKSLDDVVATVNGQPITLRQFLPPLLEAHGRQLMERMALLEFIRQDTAKEGITVTPADIARQREMTLDEMVRGSKVEERTQQEIDAAEAKGDKELVRKIRDGARADREQFLDQFLTERNVSTTDFNITMEINAYLRKKAERFSAGLINEDAIHAAFGIQYGETVRAKYIKLQNMQQVTVAKRLLDGGTRFEDVARDMSIDRDSGALGGEIPAFSRADPRMSEAMKEATFSLKPTEVSDPISWGSSFVLIKLYERIPPKAVKYESVHDILQAKLYSGLVAGKMNDLREVYTRQTVAALKIENPILREQFQKAQDRELHNREEINRAMEHDRLMNQSTPTTSPTTGAGYLDSTRPAPAIPGAPGQPPATQPGRVDASPPRP